MTSERKVYVGLARMPHASAPAITVPVGLLKLYEQGMLQAGEFAYGQRYASTPDAIALNPAHLPLQDAVFPLAERRLRDGGALPLTVRDALPDSWGRKVLEAQQQRALTDVDTLLLTNEDRVGAMVFDENLPFIDDPQASSHNAMPTLDMLADAALQIEQGITPPPEWRRLLQGGGSLGGARPKASFVHAGQRCLVKFGQQGDPVDIPLLEAACLHLAQACGIAVPAFGLHPLRKGHALLLQRFDRLGSLANERRLHYLSASALLNIPYESHEGSYTDLAQALRRYACAPAQDLAELYRRLVFNMVIGNSDDHVKNHGVLYVEHGKYRLSPAFDVVAQLESNMGYQELALSPGQYEASLDAALHIASHFGLSPETASAVILNTVAVVAQNATAVLRTVGADALMAQKVLDFWGHQAKRIA